MPFVFQFLLSFLLSWSFYEVIFIYHNITVIMYASSQICNWNTDNFFVNVIFKIIAFNDHHLGEVYFHNLSSLLIICSIDLPFSVQVVIFEFISSCLSCLLYLYIFDGVAVMQFIVYFKSSFHGFFPYKNSTVISNVK